MVEDTIDRLKSNKKSIETLATSRWAVAVLANLLSTGTCLADKFDDSINHLLAANHIPGVSIVVAKKGKVVFAKGYGYADLEHRVPMMPNSVHELASLGKQFTAAAILLLRQQGKLKLDDKLSKYFPGLNPAWNKISLLHLLNHTAGLPDYVDALSEIRIEYTRRQLLDSMRGPLVFEPGTKYVYSNTGYALLGFIVQQVSGMSLSRFLREKIWKPTNMMDTYPNDSRAIVPNRVNGYAFIEGALMKANFMGQALSAIGDQPVMSTALDLAKWDAALYGTSILNEESKKVMFTPSATSMTTDSDGTIRGYGAGYFFIQGGGETVYQHGGNNAGSTTSMFRFVKHEICTIILMNLRGADVIRINQLVDEKFAQ